MIKPERRTKGDLLAAAAIAVVVAAAAVFIWWTSDARATRSNPASEPAPTVHPAQAVPATVRQLWTADSAGTERPVMVAGTVVTADQRTVVGRDPVTGERRWSFARDRDLCGVTSAYDEAVAVYRDVRGCGQVSTINAKTGLRGPTRSGYADKHITLATDGITVLSAGPTRVELWRSDMVRTLAYGDLDAPVDPPISPEPPCRFLSTAASSSAVSVLAACPGVLDVRLTLLRVTEEDVAPELRFAQQPGVSPDSGAKVLAVAESRTAAYLPTPQPRIVVYDETGQQTASTLIGAAAVPAATAAATGDLITFWTGDSVVVLDATSLAYRYTIDAGPGGSRGPGAPLGPGAMMADRLLVPVANGIGVYDPATGAPERVVAVDRDASDPAAEPVLLGVVGTTIVEQRGAQIVGLG